MELLSQFGLYYIQSVNNHLLICCSYSPPSYSSYVDSFVTEFEKAAHTSKNQGIMIIGDLNCDLGKHNLSQTKQISSNKWK